ncbi:MAG: lipoyl(octanoyl) transferase LipB [Thermodesulfobacteriota bacterium]
MERREGHWLDLGRIPYEPAFAIQERLAKARIAGQCPTTVVVQENDPVFTIGRTGSRVNILASQEELERRGIKVLNVNRGGDVTYHGPGQIIASPLFYLGDLDLNANQYLHKLEEVLINTLAHFEIEAGAKEGYPGAWCGEAKIAAVGIAVKHGYTFHGFALNVNMDLGPFSLINPCGVKRMPVTSMRCVLGREVDPAEVRLRLKRMLGRTFGFYFADASVEQTDRMLSPPDYPEDRPTTSSGG